MTPFRFEVAGHPDPAAGGGQSCSLREARQRRCRWRAERAAPEDDAQGSIRMTISTRMLDRPAQYRHTSMGRVRMVTKAQVSRTTVV